MESGDEQVNGYLRFQLEVEILGCLNHPRIPRLVEAFSEAGVHYIVQELIPGYPLSYHLNMGRLFLEEEIRELLIQLFSILVNLHKTEGEKKAVIHRDLRLSNLLIHDEKLYLIDFGLANFQEPGDFPLCPDPPLDSKSSGPETSPPSNQNRRKPGDATYRILRREISPRSDLFGAGVVAIDLMTNWVENESDYKKPWQEVLPLSPEFKEFLEKLMSQEGGFANAIEALHVLKDLKTGDG